MKILGYNYKLERGATADEMTNWGICLHRLKKLLIASDLRPQDEISTILHEIMEALKYHLQINLPHDSLMALETGLYTVLVENGVDLSPLRSELD